MENLPAYTRQSLEASAKRIYDLTEERDEALAEADLMYQEWLTLHEEHTRVLIERNAYMQVLKDISRDHSLVDAAGAVLYHYGHVDGWTTKRWPARGGEDDR